MPPSVAWLNQNREWVFSGIGVMVLAALFGLARHIFARAKRETPSRHRTVHSSSGVGRRARLQRGASDEVDVVTHPKGRNGQTSTIADSLPKNHPDAMLDELNAMPALQRHDAIKHYIGLDVACDCRLVNAKPEGKLVRVQANTLAGSTTLFFSVDPASVPGLGRLHRGSKLFVRGRLAAIVDPWLELDNVVITF